jgi:hypothetical protein
VECLSSGLGPHVEETGQKQPPFALGGRERGGDFQLPGSLCRPAKPSQVVGQSGVPEMGPLHTDDCLQRGQPVLRAVALSDRNGPVERYDRVGCNRLEQVVEFDDPVPVRVGPARSGGVGRGQVSLSW